MLNKGLDKLEEKKVKIEGFIKNLKRMKMYETVRFQIQITMNVWDKENKLSNGNVVCVSEVQGMIKVAHSLMKKSPYGDKYLLDSEALEITSKLFKEVGLEI